MIKKVDDVAIDQGGVHYLIGKVNGKNASSNDYKMQLTALWFEPSSDS